MHLQLMVASSTTPARRLLCNHVASAYNHMYVQLQEADVNMTESDEEYSPLWRESCRTAKPSSRSACSGECTVMHAWCNYVVK